MKSFALLIVLSSGVCGAAERAPEGFKIAGKPVVEAFRDLRDLLTAKDESGASLLEDPRYRGMDAYARLDLSADDGPGAKVLGEIDLPAGLAEFVAGFSREGLKDPGYQKSPEFQVLLQSLGGELEEVRRRSKFDRDGARKRMTDLIRAGLPALGATWRTDDEIQAEIGARAVTFDALARFLGGEMKLIHHDFLRQVKRNRPELMAMALRPAQRDAAAVAPKAPPPPAPSMESPAHPSVAPAILFLGALALWLAWLLAYVAGLELDVDILDSARELLHLQ